MNKESKNQNVQPLTRPVYQYSIMYVNNNKSCSFGCFPPVFGENCLALNVCDQTPSIVLPSSVCPQPRRPVSRLMDEQQQGAVQRSMAQGRAPLSHTDPPISQSALALNDGGLGPGRRGKSDLGSVARGHSGHLEARCES